MGSGVELDEGDDGATATEGVGVDAVGGATDPQPISRRLAASGMDSVPRRRRARPLVVCADCI